MKKKLNKRVDSATPRSQYLLFLSSDTMFWNRYEIVTGQAGKPFFSQLESLYI
jgi:hypothetical protein